MTDFNEDQARQDKLEQLYADDGRHDPGHPLHGVYTGLWESYMAELSKPAAEPLQDEANSIIDYYGALARQHEGKCVYHPPASATQENTDAD
jgi:hypothetical protein